jgi:hypothetical protein
MDAAAPAKRGRSLVGFYVALGVVAALVGLGVLLYKPLTLCYAIHAVRSGRCTELPGIFPRARNRWLEVCLDAARGGNRRAMDALVECSRPGPGFDAKVTDADFVGPSRLYLAAEARPGVFGAALDRLDDRRAREVIEHITLSCLAGEVGDQCDAAFGSLAHQAAELARLSRLDKPGVARVAQAALDFARRRFARELAEAEEAEKKLRVQAGGTTRQ